MQDYQTSPAYYDGNLSELAGEERGRREEQLDALYAKKRNAKGVEALKLQKRIDILEVRIDLQGANPKEVPFEELVEHIRTPHGENPLGDKYIARIKNRATAIRAYCVSCQGFELVGVKECPSLNCPLHPFRMGKDPFRGWDIPKFEEPELSENEIDEAETGAFSDGSEGSEADGD